MIDPLPLVLSRDLNNNTKKLHMEKPDNYQLGGAGTGVISGGLETRYCCMLTRMSS